MAGFVLYLSYQQRTLEYPLYTGGDTHISLDLEKLGMKACLDMTVWDNIWTFEENKYFDVYIIDKTTHKLRMTAEAQIKNNNFVYFKNRETGEQLRVLSIETDSEFTTYTKYTTTDGKIRIGSSPDNDVVINSPWISEHHCELLISGEKAKIRDLQSKYGTVVNGERITTEPVVLYPMDTIIMSGHRIVFLGSVLAVNKPKCTSCSLNILTSLSSASNEEIVKESDVFVRAPRLIQPFDDDKITLEAPPSKHEADEMPFIFTIGPAITMPMPMLMSMTINMTLNSGAGRSPVTYIAMGASMVMSACLGLIWNTARTKYRKKKEIEDEARRVDQYNKYIQKNVELIEKKESFNRGVLEQQFLETQDLLLSLNGHKERIWNRNVNHTDFLTVRLGKGSVKNFNEVEGPAERFSMTADDLLEVPHQVVEEHEYLKDVPATIDLKQIENKIIGVVGEYDKVHTVVQNIILQVSALHSYADVKICVLYNADEAEYYDWVRWLPHTFSADKRVRFVGNTEETRQRIATQLIGALKGRQPDGVDEEKEVESSDYPKYIIVATSDKVFDGNTLGSLMTSKHDIGATFILAYSTLEGVPNECKALIECSKDFTGYYRLDLARDASANIEFDVIPDMLPEWYSRRISGFNIKEIASGEIPGAIDFMSLLGIGKLEQWDLEKKYRENHAYDSIKALLGLGASSKEVYLDLHEKKHGPHGLVAGTTGSGKSETLQTAILSWMLNYSPNEVAFVLIDYKGGGMANLFKGVPHIAGTITNISDDEETEENDEEATVSLDDSQTRRALTAIKSEIKYRQDLFRTYKVNHIDAYMRLYQSKKADEPLPHLIMISDEFAELKKEQPAFIKELVSAARVGRSLGIHLILATQKPGNSVDDEIWANSRFKICLRVQDKADSVSMLKRPEAAFITKTGRGLFQLGNNEIFEEFQSGWSGAPYVPKDKIMSPEDGICTMIEVDGLDTPIETAKVHTEETTTQLENCVQYLITRVGNMGIAPARQLWPPQLTKKMYLEDLMSEYTIQWKNALMGYIGLTDDPERQSQYPTTINLYNTTNLLVVGSPSTGKSTLLETLLYSLVLKYTPEDFSLYLIDLSSNALSLFSNLRCCGGFINADSDPEKVIRLVQLLEKKIAQRKEMFMESNVGNYVEYRRKHKLPMLLVVIDNWLSFVEIYNDRSDNLLNSLTIIMREGVKYGIQFIVSTARANDIRMKQRANILSSVTLVLPEKGDYREVHGVPADFVPAPYHGRGLTLVGKKLLEFHTALPVHGASEAERNETLFAELKKHNERFKQYERAESIPIIPKEERYDEFYDKACTESHLMPIGYDTTDISKVYVNWYETFCLGVSDAFIDFSGISLLMSNILYSLQRSTKNITLIKQHRRVVVDMSSVSDICSTTESVYAKLREVEQEVYNRIKLRNEFRKAGNTGDFAAEMWKQGKELFVVIDDFTSLYSLLTESPYTKQEDASGNYPSNSLLESYELIFQRGADYGVYFIIGINGNEAADVRRSTIFKNFIANDTTLHVGGKLNNVVSFKYQGSVAKGNEETGLNGGIYNKNGTLKDIFVPINSV